MITSLHYYSYYRPRILRSDDNAVRQVPFKKTIAYSQPKPYNLSTAYKDNVISYAKNLSDSVNDTKMYTNETLTLINTMVTDDSEREQLGLTKKNNSKTVDSLKKSLKELAKSFNKAKGFADNNSQSDSYDKFSQEIESIIGQNGAMADIGIYYKDGEYQYNEEKLSNISFEEIKDKMITAYDELTEIHQKTKDFMSTPLSNHMSFKSFSYYYSYSAGIIKNDSFNLISSGTLLDLEL